MSGSCAAAISSRPRYLLPSFLNFRRTQADRATSPLMHCQMTLIARNRGNFSIRSRAMTCFRGLANGRDATRPSYSASH